MCMIEDSDGTVTSLHDCNHTARKEHKCTECCRTIERGEVYKNERYVWDGSAHTQKTCAHCQVVRAWLTATCGGWVYGGLREDIAEHFHEGCGIESGRLTIGMMRKWHRRDGRLMPIPTLKTGLAK